MHKYTNLLYAHRRACQAKKHEKIRFFTESRGKSSLRARLRTRKVTGRDASLPAPLLATSLGLVGRGTVGALPQTPQGTLSLDPARGRRKGTKSPLDPFSRLSWSRFHAPSACSFLVLRLSTCLLPQLSVKNPKSFRALIADSEPARVRHPLRNGRLHRRDGRVPEFRCAFAGEIPFAAGNTFILQNTLQVVVV